MSIDVIPSLPAAARAAAGDTDETGRLRRLAEAIEHAAHLLPAQGPIGVFIHHNTLHAFEHLPFEDAVRRGGEVFGCRSFLPEERYREEMRKGRIRFAELRAVLRDDLGPGGDEPVTRLGTRLELRLAMVEHPLRGGTDAEVRWFVQEADALRKVRPEASGAARARLLAETRHWVMRDLRGARERPAWAAELFRRFNEAAIEEWDEARWEAFALESLWAVCRAGVRGLPAPPAPPPPRRHRDLLLAVTGEDSDALVHGRLIPFCAAFLDQGLSHWPLPNRERGFLEAFCALYRAGAPDVWARGLAAEAGRLLDRGVTPLRSVAESLDALGVEEEEWEEFLSATLLALRGWAGMVRQVEERGDKVAHPVPEGSLAGFLAVHLLLERFALAHLGGRFGPPRELRAELGRRHPRPAPPGEEARGFPIFQLAQVLGWPPADLHRLGPADWEALAREVEAFGAGERERVFHLAYELRFRTRALDAIALHAGRRATGEAARPRFQTVFCIDEREESMRRHLEEVAPDAETLGAAGFFSVAMYYRGAADAHFVPLCPVVLRPRHWVEEQACAGQEHSHRRTTRLRRLLGRLSHQVHVASRTFALGALLSAFGALASAPLVARVLFPRWTARLRRRLGGFTHAAPETRLALRRSAAEPGPAGPALGFSPDEMAACGERLLGDLGCAERLARLVLLVGHGSSSLNNPHRSAYDCGACGGSAGGPNARAMASILNDPAVRERLARRGFAIPSDTVFVGGWHNTCNDTVTFHDLDALPESHRAEFDAARRDLDEACRRNAHERCRRFLSAPLTMSFAAAHRHVEARSEDLAQTRPELGHATNALCVVGRRERTRGLFLDRRAFLVSYDPTRDDARASVLTRTLQAVVPVCAGINLEYYFSRVDCPGWGCGSKLPHNITALLGVMDGAASDLRTGLPWQMVELHEPVRLLIVLEATPEAVLGLLAREPGIARLARNGWFHLAVLDPASAQVRLFSNGAFEPYRPEAAELPRAAASVDWYRGWRDHLEFAAVGPQE
jgi:hypothetical protein